MLNPQVFLVGSAIYFVYNQTLQRSLKLFERKK